MLSNDVVQAAREMRAGIFVNSSIINDRPGPVFDKHRNTATRPCIPSENCCQVRNAVASYYKRLKRCMKVRYDLQC